MENSNNYAILVREARGNLYRGNYKAAGDLFLKLNWFSDAANAYEKAKKPDLVREAWLAGAKYAKKRKFKFMAAEYYEKAGEFEKSSPVYREYAKKYMACKWYEKAAKLYDKLNDHLNSKKAWKLAIESFLKSGKWDMAVEAYEKMSLTKIQSIKKVLEVAISRKDSEWAAAAYKKIKPSKKDWKVLGDIALATGMYKDAIKYYSKYGMAKKKANGLVGNRLYERKHYLRAAEYLKKAGISAKKCFKLYADSLDKFKCEEAAEHYIKAGCKEKGIWRRILKDALDTRSFDLVCTAYIKLGYSKKKANLMTAKDALDRGMWYEEAAECYEKAGELDKAKEQWKLAADKRMKEAKNCYDYTEQLKDYDGERNIYDQEFSLAVDFYARAGIFYESAGMSAKSKKAWMCLAKIANARKLYNLSAEAYRNAGESELAKKASAK